MKIARYISVASLALSLGALPAVAAEPAKADPRTMTFKPLNFSIPKTERAVLANGMVVHMLEDHELPIVNITAYVRTGGVYEPPEKAGLAGLTGAVMRSGGTLELAPEALDEELEFMASSVESYIGSDAGGAAVTTLSRNLDRTLAIFSQVLMKPAFREDRVKLAINRTLESLRRQNDDPKGIAGRELRKALYAGHPLGQYPRLETVGRIVRDDLVQFHRRFYRPDNLILAVSGDFNRKDLLVKLEKHFAGWRGEGEMPAPVADPAMEMKPAVLLVQKEVNQSVIRMGHGGIDKNNPDLHAIKVMDYILGGGFTSRLMQEIRSNQGLAYNATGGFEVGRRFAGIFEAETETKSESTARTVELMLKIIGDMTKAPVSDEELNLARDAIINSFIFGFTKPDVIVSQRARLEYYAYPPDYLEKYRERISRVTREDVLRVARKYLRPEAMTVLVVGDAGKFDKPLSTVGKVQEIRLENGK